MFGKELFWKQLEGLGYQPQDKGDNRVSFVFLIREGRFSGQSVAVGVEVPGDFPATCPSGPHITPRLIPINTGGAGNDRAAESGPFGAEWQYLSRPFPSGAEGWNRTTRNVKAYLHHVRHILHTL